MVGWKLILLALWIILSIPSPKTSREANMKFKYWSVITFCLTISLIWGED